MKEHNIKTLLRSYEAKRDRASYEREKRKLRIRRELPDYQAVEDRTNELNLQLARLALGSGNPARIQSIRSQLENLQQRKAILLTENNYPLNYLDLHYECERCKDTGYVEGKPCTCLQQALIDHSYAMSNLSHVLEKENFSSFNISLFSNEPFEGFKETPRQNMFYNLSVAESFVANFNESNDENLLLYGGTGQGKTFLCNAIAKALLDQSKVVLYQTAFSMLDTIRTIKFSRGDKQTIQEDYRLLFDSDLLIIDDLGTEVASAFSNAEIFNIINTRLIKGNKTILSTNLPPSQLETVYKDRIVSRIFSAYTPLVFFGPDLRWE
jgi:DNA replication protein DnaC